MSYADGIVAAVPTARRGPDRRSTREAAVAFKEDGTPSVPKRRGLEVPSGKAIDVRRMKGLDPLPAASDRTAHNGRLTMSSPLQRFAQITLLALASAAVSVALASENVETAGTAIRGHDPVSQVNDEPLAKSSRKPRIEHKGAALPVASEVEGEAFTVWAGGDAPQDGGHPGLTNASSDLAAEPGSVALMVMVMVTVTSDRLYSKDKHGVPTLGVADGKASSVEPTGHDPRCRCGPRPSSERNGGRS